MPDDPALAIAVPLIKRFEGLRLSPYKDISGVYTIGYGQTYLSNGAKVTATTPPITEETADEWLTSGVGKHIASVRGMINPRIYVSNNAVAALTSFSWNEGTHALRESSIMRLINVGMVQDAAYYFLSYIYANGAVSDGLRQRRWQERALFLTPDPPPVEQPSAEELNAEELGDLNETD